MSITRSHRRNQYQLFKFVCVPFVCFLSFQGTQTCEKARLGTVHVIIILGVIQLTVSGIPVMSSSKWSRTIYWFYFTTKTAAIAICDKCLVLINDDKSGACCREIELTKQWHFGREPTERVGHEHFTMPSAVYVVYLDLHQGADICFLPVNHIIKTMLTLGGISLKECEHKQSSTKQAAYVSETLCPCFGALQCRLCVKRLTQGVS